MDPPITSEPNHFQIDLFTVSVADSHMADIAIADMLPSSLEPTRKKRSNSRKALKQKDSSTNEANILAQKVSESSSAQVPPPSPLGAEKENHEGLSQPRISPKKSKGKAVSKAKQAKDSLEKELLEMQEKLRQMCLEKEKNEELLKSRDEMLKQKEEELELKGREQEKLQTEFKKLQKLKEFNPTVSFPVVQSLRDKEQDKKEKKKKGYAERKRPSTAYILWCKDQWNEVKKENPNADFKEVSNMLGAKWKQIAAEEKKPYEEKYQAEREAYLREIAKEKRECEALKLLEEDQKQKTAMELLEQYIQFKEEAKKENIKKDKKEKDPLKPKHPLSAFFVFSNERRAALLAQGKNILEVSKAASEEWKSMTAEQKRPYEEIASKNKEKYQQEMEAYKQKKDEEANDLKREEEELMKLQKQEGLQLLKKKEKTENMIKKTKDEKKKKQNDDNKNVDPNKPKRPASSYLLFSKEARKSLNEERPGMNNSTLTAMIAVKWKELSEEERQVWNAKAAEAMEVYKKELEEYNKSAASGDQQQ